MMVMVVAMPVVMVVIVVVHLTAEVVVAVAGVKDAHLDEIEKEAHNGDNEHNSALDLGWHEESFGSLT